MRNNGYTRGKVLVANPRENIKLYSPKELPTDEEGKLNFYYAKKLLPRQVRVSALVGLFR